ARPRTPSRTCATARRSARPVTPPRTPSRTCARARPAARPGKPCVTCGTARRAAASPDHTLPPALCGLSALPRPRAGPVGSVGVLTSRDAVRPRCPGLPPWPRDGYSEVQGIRAAQEQVHVAVGGAEMPGPPLDLHRC